MTDSPLVSVVIPNHNYGKFVTDAVESVLCQDYSLVEIVVVDNGSTDNSIDRLSQFGNRIQLIAQDDQGQAGGRNRGISESHGDFIAFLDADDTWDSKKLSSQIPLFENPSVGLVYSSITVCGPDLEPLHVDPALYKGDCRQAFLDRIGSAVVVGGESTSIVRRSCLLEVGGFDPVLTGATGWDLYRRIASNHEFDFVNKPLANYRQHGINLHLQPYYREQYYCDMASAYQKLFKDPDWSDFFDQQRKVETRLKLAKTKDLVKASKSLKAVRHGLSWIRQKGN